MTGTSNRRRLKVRDLGRVVTGKTPSTASPENFGSDYPFLTPTDMHGSKWARRTERGLSSTGASTLRGQIPAGAIAVSCIGWQMGKAILTDRPTYTNQQINAIIPNAGVDAEYLYYYFATRRDELLSIGAAGGVRTPIISKSSFEALDVEVPDLCAQRDIASVLSAYDDLIENNTRRIAILEEMARRIYEEWFVRFRSPGNEGARMVESELGLVPEGWRLSRVGDLFRTVLGGTPSRTRMDYWKDGKVQWVNSGKVNELRILEPSELITELALARSATKLMPAGTTVLAITGATLGQVSMLGREMCANQSVLGVVPPNARWTEFVFWSFKTHIGRIIQRASGGAQQHINKDIVNDIKLITPPEDLLDSFNEVAGPMNELVLTLARKNLNLRKTRDLLLPRLISGELDVSAMPELVALAA